MNTKDDYYQLLGVRRDASPEQISAAFKRLSKAYHPDAGATDPDKMVEVNEAHDTLSDPNARAAYDARLRGKSEPPPNAQAPPRSTWQEERARQTFRDSYANRRPQPMPRISRVAKFFKRRSKIMPVLIVMTYLIGAQFAKIFAPAVSATKTTPPNGAVQVAIFLILVMIAAYMVLRDARAKRFDRSAISKLQSVGSKVFSKFRDTSASNGGGASGVSQ